MQQAYTLGVDIGTGSTKAVALNNGGDVLATAQRFYTSITSGQKREQDIDTVWHAFLQCLAQIKGSLQQNPSAVSLSSAMHSLILVDKENNPLTGAILWSDTRSTAIAASLRSSPLGEEIYLATGTPLHSMSPLCKIRWFSEHQPDLFSQTARFVSIKELFWHRLFGEYCIDHSLASATGLFHVQNLRWDDKALQFAEITAQQLSQPVSVSYSKTGLPQAMQEETGLSADTLFVIGGSDGCLANLGSLCLSPSEAAVTIGTSAAVRITTGMQVQDRERMLFSYILDENSFVCGGAVNNGGNVFQWLLNELFAEHETVKNYEQLFGAIDSVPPGSKGLLFLPYLHGERAPIWDEKSCAVFIGLTARHNLYYLARAVAEGVCFALYQLISSLEEVCGGIEQIAVSGGLIQSASMMQLLADVTGKNVVVQQRDDASAIGAAYLAQKTLGIVGDYGSLTKNDGMLFRPQDAVHTLYRQYFLQYVSLYPLLKEHMHSLHQFHR